MINKQQKLQAASKVATTTPQGCEYMTSRRCLSNAPVLEFEGPGCHSLQLPLLLQCKSCYWKTCQGCQLMLKCHATMMIMWHGLMAAHHEQKQGAWIISSQRQVSQPRTDCTQRKLALAYVHVAVLAERICFRGLDPNT